MTKGEFVSTIQSDLRFQSKDTLVSRRHILSVGESYAKTFLAQRLDESKLEAEYSLITTLPCFEMEEVDYIKCGFVNLKECRNIMKSKNKLPETIKGSTGYAIFYVTTIDDSIEYEPTTRGRFVDRLKTKYIRNNRNFYFIEDDHLYLPNDTTEVVKVQMLALDEEAIEEACSECNENINTENSAKCISLWDEKFMCPDKLLMGVRTATLQELSTMAQIPKDENPNLNSNVK